MIFSTIMTNVKPFCTVPFVEAFSGIKSGFRNCCVADPQILSDSGQQFNDWWQDPRLTEFRDRLQSNQWPDECHRCRVQEQQSGSSFRTVINQTVQIDKNFGAWPSRWNLKFGNICNLACWTCNEDASSVIAEHKRRIDILPESFVDPEQQFQSDWQELQKNVLKSYDYHDTVTLTLLGGEPLFNKTVEQFLIQLMDLGLASRTRLEFHTNATQINPRLFSSGTWNYVCVFLSLDAVGTKAEWLRYGCRWASIEKNIEFFKSAVDYVEVHCTLSVLNVNDLPALDVFCQQHGLELKISLLANPWFMSILSWPAEKDQIADNIKSSSFSYYYDLIGSQSRPEAVLELDKYIEQFGAIRKNLADYDAKLAHAIKVSAH
jgi:sulfatase maturation enzyme AslB (radical SAM superfamily)